MSERGPRVKLAMTGSLVLVSLFAAALMMWPLRPHHQRPERATMTGSPADSLSCPPKPERWAAGVHQLELSLSAQYQGQDYAIKASGELHIIPASSSVELALIDATLEGQRSDAHQRVRLKLDQAGGLESMAFHPALTPTSRGVLTFLARAIAESRPDLTMPSPRTQAATQGPEGIATSRHEDTCTSTGELVHTTTRSKWRSLYLLEDQPVDGELVEHDSKTIKTFSTQLEQLHHHTSIKRTQPAAFSLLNVLTMHRLSKPVSKPSPPSQGWVVASAYPSAQAAPAPGQALLIKRVAGLTWEQMHDALIKHDLTGVMPEHERWLWRASGLLKLHPELAPRLAELALDERMALPGKLLIMDLLANVGHAQAQAALLTVLDDPRVYGEPVYAALAQRALLLTSPQVETAQAFAKQLRHAPNSSTLATAASILGASIARVDPASRPELIDALMAPCATACDVDTRADLLVGLGNAGAAETTALVQEQLRSSEVPEQRARALMALRRVDTKEARALLLDALAHPGTAPEALTTLSHHELDDHEANRLLERLQETNLPATAHHALLQMLRALSKTHPEQALKAIDQLRAQDQLQGRQRAALMALRRQLVL